jgi:elongation factor Tu
MRNGIRIRARITLLPSSESGRTVPLRGSYRPNHNFGAADNREMDIGFLEFGEGKLLHPGETIEREIVFWSRAGLSEVLVPGREWRIQEGSRLIGIGTVLEVLGEWV